MAKVVFPDHLQKYTEGVREVDIPCKNFRNLVKELNGKWPGIDSVLEQTAVAIDGQIFQDAWLEEIQPESEVFFMQRIEGG